MTNSLKGATATRTAFSNAVLAGDKFTAINLAREIWTQDPSARQIAFLNRELERAPFQKLGLKPLRVALLSSFSIEFIKQPLTVLGFLSGVHVEIYSASFGQFRQDILNPGSGLYAFSPDVVILAVEGRDWLPEIYRDYIDFLAGGFDAVLLRFQEEVQNLVDVFRRQCRATLLINNFSAPVWPHLGILDGRPGPGQAQLIQRLNEWLASLCVKTEAVFTVDYASLVSRVGSLRWYDDRLCHYAKAPIAIEMLPQLAAEYVKFFRALTGQTKKCLVLDLDNTLWGGVLGEDGLTGIQLGPDYPGNAYLEFQREILNLHKRGVILAIASKNNPADVEEVFAKHPAMLLKKEHFASIQVHWSQKSQSLQEIARRLNVGLEQTIFVDDNQAECEEVMRFLPMVKTINLPKQPEHFVRCLLEEGWFDGTAFSAEDRRRGDLYRQREQVEQAREHSGSLEDFYHSLEMEVAFALVNKTSLSRSAQLTQKTNQFNVTTLRFSELDIAQRIMLPEWLLVTTSVRDRFGDNGIVGLMMARFHAEVLEIETFLLSCRVIGRDIETAMLAYLCRCASSCGFHLLKGKVIPSAKNLPAQDLFSRHGFQKTSQNASGETFWTLDVTQTPISFPDWMKVITEVAVPSI
jgi:FkbH-like protein